MEGTQDFTARVTGSLQGRTARGPKLNDDCSGCSMENGLEGERGRRQSSEEAVVARQEEGDSEGRGGGTESTRPKATARPQRA